MTSPFEQADFDEFDDPHPAYCLTAVRSADVAAVLDILLPRRRVEPMTWEAARTWVLANFDSTGGLALAAAARSTDGWTYVWEENGYQGSLVPRMTTLSDLGPAISAFRTAAALGSFVYAEGRRIVRRFEPLDPRADPAAQTGEPLPDEALLDWSTGRADSAAMTLLANLCGLYPQWPDDGDDAVVYFS